MFEGIVASVLNRVLGDFIEGLDAKQLKLSVWSGNVDLQDLRVKPSGLEFLQLPIIVKSGVVGRLSLKANWRKLSSAPVVVVLDRVFVVAGPRTSFDFDVKEESKRALATKLALLEAVEQVKLSSSLASSIVSDAPSTFTTRMIESIVQNIHITIKSIHIRYEDVADPVRPLALGIVLHNLTVTSTNGKWEPEFIKKEKDSNVDADNDGNLDRHQLYKLVTLDKLFAYFNASGQGAKPVEDSSALAQLFADYEIANESTATLEPAKKSSGMQQHSHSHPGHDYLVQPVSGFVRLTITRDPQVGAGAPQLRAVAGLDSLTGTLARKQYQGVLRAITGISRAIYADTVRASNLAGLFRRGNDSDRRTYTELYKRALNAPGLSELTKADIAKKEQMERDLRYEDIARWRAFVIVDTKRRLPEGENVAFRGKGKKKGVFKRFFSRSSKKKKAEALAAAAAAVEEDEENGESLDSLYEQFAFDASKEKISALSSLPEDFVHLQADFTLRIASIALLDTPQSFNSPITRSILYDTHFSITIAAHNAQRYAVSLQNITLRDYMTKGTLYTDLITVQNAIKKPTVLVTLPKERAASLGSDGASGSGAPPFFSIVYEIHPQKKKADLALAVTLRELQFVMHAPWVGGMVGFLNPPEPVDLWAISSWSSRQLARLSALTGERTFDLLRERFAWGLSISAAAPTVVMPVDPCAKDCDVLVLDLGQMSLVSEATQSKADVSLVQVEIQKQLDQGKTYSTLDMPQSLRSKCYDRVHVSLENIQLFLSRNGPDWRTVGCLTHTYLVKPFSLQFAVDKCVVPTLRALPAFSIEGALPDMHVVVSSSRLVRLSGIVTGYIGEIVKRVRPPSVVGRASAASVVAMQSATVAFRQRQQRGHVGEGDLSFQELSRALRSEIEAERVMKELDENGDGRIGRKEFEKWCEKRRNVLVHAHILHIFFLAPSIVISVLSDTMEKKIGTRRSDALTMTIKNSAWSMRQRTFDVYTRFVIQNVLLENAVVLKEGARNRDGGDVLDNGCAKKHILLETAHAPSIRVLSDANEITSIAGTAAVQVAPIENGGGAAASVPEATSLATQGGFLVAQQVWTSEESPAFRKTPVQHSVSVGMGLLKVHIDPLSVWSIGNFVLEELMPALLFNGGRGDELEDPDGSMVVVELASATPSADAVAAILASSGAHVRPEAAAALLATGLSQNSTASAAAKRHALTVFKLDLAFAGLDVVLDAAPGRHVADVSVRDFAFGYRKFKHSMSVSVNLSHIRVRDCTSAGKMYSDVLTVAPPATQQNEKKNASKGAALGLASSSLVAVVYDTFSVREVDYPGHGGALFAQIRGLRLLVLNRFIKEVAYYFTTGPIGEIAERGRDSAVAVAALGARQRLRAAGARALASTLAPLPAEDGLTEMSKTAKAQAVLKDSYMQVSAKLNDVEVFVPLSSRSGQGVRARVDNVVVSSSRENSHARAPAHQRISIVMSTAEISSLLYGPMESRGGAGEVPLLSNVFGTLPSLSIDVDNIVADKLLVIAAKLESCSVSLTHSAYWLLVRLSQPGQNFAEMSTVILPPARSDPFAGDFVSPTRERRGQRVGQKASLTSKPLMGDQQIVPSGDTGAVFTKGHGSALTTRITMGLTNFSLSVLDEHFNVGELQEMVRTPLVDFDVHDGALSLDIRSNGHLQMSASLGAIALRDSSPQSNVQHVYRDLCVVQAEQGQFPVQVRVIRNDFGVDVQVSVGNVRFILAKVMFSLSAFFATSAKNYEAASAVVAAKLEEHLLDAEAAAAALLIPSSDEALLHGKDGATHGGISARDGMLRLSSVVRSGPEDDHESLPTDVSMRVRVQGAEALLVADPEADSSTAFVLSFQMEAHASSIRQRLFVAAQMSSVNVVQKAVSVGRHEIRVEQADYASIVAPFSVETLAQISPSTFLTGESMQSVDVKMGEVRTRFTVRNYRVLMVALDAFLPDHLREQLGLVQKVKGGSAPVVAQDVVSIERGEDEFVPDAGMSAVASIQSSSDRKFTSFGEQYVRIAVGGASFLLVNDALRSEVPLAWFRVSDFQSSAYGFAQRRTAMLRARVTVDFYNMAVIAWEPLLEPWKLSLNVRQTLSTLIRGPGSLRTIATLASEGDLNLNVKQSMIDSMLEALTVVRRGADSILSTSKAADVVVAGSKKMKAENIASMEHHPFVIENETEFDMEVLRGTLDSVASLARIVNGHVPLGVQSGHIPNEHMTSSYNVVHGQACFARLHHDTGRGGWASYNSSDARGGEHYLQIELERVEEVTQIAVQGCANSYEWVTSYYVKYSVNGETWRDYTGDKSRKATRRRTMKGNIDMRTPSMEELSAPFKAKFVRFFPLAWVQNPVMRVELYRRATSKDIRDELDWVKDATKSGALFVVPARSSRGFDFGSLTAAEAITERHAVRVAVMQPFGWYPLVIPVGVVSVNTFVQYCEAATGTGFAAVTVDVGIHHGSKLISIHSPIGLVNVSGSEVSVDFRGSGKRPVANTVLLEQLDKKLAKAAASHSLMVLPHNKAVWVPLLSVQYRPKPYNFTKSTDRLLIVDYPTPFEAGAEVNVTVGCGDVLFLKNAKDRKTAAVLSASLSSPMLLQLSYPMDVDVHTHQFSGPSGDAGTTYNWLSVVPGLNFAHEQRDKANERKDTDAPGVLPSLHTVEYGLAMPFVIENLLAQEAEVRVTNRQSTAPTDQISSASVAISSGGVRSVGVVHIGTEAELSVRIPAIGCVKWPAPAIIHGKEGLASKRSIFSRKLVRSNMLLKDNSESRRLMVQIDTIITRGVCHVVLYVTHWFFDLTDLNLTWSENMRWLTPRGPASKPLASGGDGTSSSAANDNRLAQMFSFARQVEKPHVFMQAEGLSEWSNRLSVDAVGTDGSFTMRSKDGRLLDVGVSVRTAPGRFARTKLVTLAPRYVVVNELPFAVCLAQASPVGAPVPGSSGGASAAALVGKGNHSPVVHVGVGERIHFHWPLAKLGHRLFARRDPHGGWYDSGIFNVTGVGETMLVVRHKDDPVAKWVLRVDVRMRSSTAFIILQEVPTVAGVNATPATTMAEKQQLQLRYSYPYAIDNRSVTHTIRFRQRLSKAERAMQGHYPSMTPTGFLTAPPCTRFPFAWAQPMWGHEIDVEVGLVTNASGRVVKCQYATRLLLDEESMEEYGSEDLIHVYKDARTGHTLQRKAPVYIFVESDGPVRVLVVSDTPAMSSRRSKEKNAKRQVEVAARLASLQSQMSNLGEELTQLYLLKQKESERLNMCRNLEKISARPKLAGHVSELRVRVIEARGLSTAGAAVRVNFFNLVKRETECARKDAGGAPMWAKDFAFNCTNTNPESVFEIVVIEKRSGLFKGGDRAIGGVRIRLNALKSHLPVERWVKLRQLSIENEGGTEKIRAAEGGGELKLRLHWIGPSSEYVDSVLADLRRQIVEKRRVLDSVSIKLQAIRGGPSEKDRQRAAERAVVSVMRSSSVGDSRGRSSVSTVAGDAVHGHAERGLAFATLVSPFRGLPCVEFTVRVLDVHNLAALVAKRAGCNISGGRVTCVLSVPLLRSQSSVVLYDSRKMLVPISAKEPAQEQGFTMWVPRLLLERAEGNSHLMDMEFSFFFSKKGTPAMLKKEGGVTAQRSAAPGLSGETVAPAMQIVSVPIKLGVVRVRFDEVRETQRSEWGAAIDEALRVADEKSDRPTGGKGKQEWHRCWRTLLVGLRDNPKEQIAKVCLSIARHVAFPDDQRPSLSARAFLPHMGISVIDGTPEELFYMSLTGSSLDYQVSESQRTLEGIAGRFQIDCQTYTSFPVILCPTPVPKNEVQPFLQLSINQTVAPHIPVKIFPYFSVLVQSMDVCVEERIALLALRFVNDSAARYNLATVAEEDDVKTDEHQQLTLQQIARVISQQSVKRRLKIPASQGLDKLCFKYLQIQPLALNVTFQSSPGARAAVASGGGGTGAGRDVVSGGGVSVWNPFDALLNMGLATVGNVDNAPVRLNGKVIENATGSVDVVVGALVKHYIQQGLMEVYKVLGSVEFLGNPVGLISNLGTGVADFFYEPVKGLVKSPQDFGLGLAKGSISLLKNTFRGVFGAASAITGSVGKGVAALTMDDDFIARTHKRSQKKQKHLGSGLSSGVKSLGAGIFKGVTGLVTDPIKGAKRDGVSGFFKGVGKGIVGVVAKPTVGVFDMTTQTLKGIGNTASFLIDRLDEHGPQRPQRYIPPTGLLSVYDRKMAENHAKQVQKKKKNFLGM